MSAIIIQKTIHQMVQGVIKYFFLPDGVRASNWMRTAALTHWIWPRVLSKHLISFLTLQPHTLFFRLACQIGLLNTKTEKSSNEKEKLVHLNPFQKLILYQQSAAPRRWRPGPWDPRPPHWYVTAHSYLRETKVIKTRLCVLQPHKSTPNALHFALNAQSFSFYVKRACLKILLYMVGW